MSGKERQAVLRFSLGFTAVQAIFMAAIAGFFAYFANQYWFHADEMLARPVSGRHAWFGELANTNGGKTGVIIGVALALLCTWYLWVAARRFLTKGYAAMLTETGLIVHPTYRRTAEIPFAAILWAEVQKSRRYLFSFYVLDIGIAGMRPVRIASREIEGGREALETCAAELNALHRSGGDPLRGIT